MQIDFKPTNENAFGIALLAGRVVGTVAGSTGHITVRAICKAKLDGRWATVPFEKATHVFLDVPSPDGDYADKIGTYYPPNAAKWAGHFFEDRNADPVRVKAARYLLATVAGQNNGTHVLKSERCARCSRELTHPDSITGQFGPECMKHVSAFMPNRSGTDEAQHQAKGAPVMSTGNEYGAPPADAPPIIEKQAPPLKHPVDMTDAELVGATARPGDIYDKELSRRNLHRDEAWQNEQGGKSPEPPSYVAPSRIVAVLKAGDDPAEVLAGLK